MTLAELFELWPHLKAYLLLYRGSRMLVFGCSSDTEGNYGFDALLRDRMSRHTEVGWGKKQPDGSFVGFVPYGPHELTVTGADAREFAQDGLGQLDRSMKQC